MPTKRIFKLPMADVIGDVTSVEFDKLTPETFALPDAIKALLTSGIDMNAREPLRGTTALMWAVEQKHPAAVKALLDAGADFSLKSAGAGLPRNYMSSAVNTAAVEAAAQRQMRAVAAGHTDRIRFGRPRDVLNVVAVTEHVHQQAPRAGFLAELVRRGASVAGPRVDDQEAVRRHPGMITELTNRG